MTRTSMVVVAGLVSVLTGCSQLYGRGSEVMRGDRPVYRHGGERMNSGMMGSGYNMAHGMGMMQDGGRGPGVMRAVRCAR